MALRLLALAFLFVFAGPSQGGELEVADEPLSGSVTAAIGRVNTGTGTYCTGTLVAPDLVLTAAHCFYNRKTGRWLPSTSIHFVLGYSRGDYAFHSVGEAYAVGSGKRREGGPTIEDDWALVRLQERASDQYRPLEPSLENPEGLQVRVYGYAAPRRHRLSQSPICRANTVGAFLISLCPTAPGMSGGPILDVHGQLIGVQVGMKEDKAGRVLMVGLPFSTMLEGINLPPK